MSCKAYSLVGNVADTTAALALVLNTSRACASCKDPQSSSPIQILWGSIFDIMGACKIQYMDHQSPYYGDLVKSFWHLTLGLFGNILKHAESTDRFRLFTANCQDDEWTGSASVSSTMRVCHRFRAARYGRLFQPLCISNVASWPSWKMKT
jgi:hypothetical protein